MTSEAVIHLAITIAMSLAGTVFWFWVNGQKGFQREVDQRFDAAGKEVSRLASVVQGLVLLEGRLKLDIQAAIVEARHSAVDQIMPQLGALSLDKMDAALHTEQLAELRRRLERLEQR